jgi:hypothetical protein
MTMKNKQQWLNENDITCLDDGARLINDLNKTKGEWFMFLKNLDYLLFFLVFTNPQAGKDISY